MKHDERGAALIIMALIITTLALVVAIVVDLGSTRVDRRTGQLAVDTAVASAGKTMAETNAEDGCDAALSYLAATLGTPSFIIQSGACSDFDPLTCVDTVARPVEATFGAFTATVYNPVPDDSPLFEEVSVIGDGEIPGSGSDASPCDRIGVRLTTVNDSFFGGIAGVSDRRSTVHAVAAVNGDPNELQPVNLLILNRTRCDALVVSGSNTRLIVARPTDDLSGQGVIGVDSDGMGSPSCNSPGSTSVRINGNNARIQADGLCEDNVTTTCGRIDLFALPTDGDGDCRPPSVDNDDVPGCNEANGFIQPNALPMDDRYTRSLIDYRYNCKSSYLSEPWYAVQPIPACEEAAATQPHVDQMYTFGASAAATTPAGWTTLPGPSVPSFGCNMSGDLTIPQGNYVINCTTGGGFRVTSGNVSFSGGNVVFRGEVNVNGGNLAFNTCSNTVGACAPGVNALTWTPGSVLNKSQWSEKASWVYVNAQVRVAAAAEFNKTSLFLGASGSFVQTSTGASVKWVAPDEGLVQYSAGPFDDLGLWTRGTVAHSFSGGGASDFSGLFFGGLAPFDFSGGANLTLDDAQFVSDTISFTGGAIFTMAPTEARTISFPVSLMYSLIR